ncbi:uncharacterized protein [Penaeus vannamei]|uniref:uncharacterized protein n=1 Tax=Penaeus vannamei TaxID=6689 RepID=UPI00387F4749
MGGVVKGAPRPGLHNVETMPSLENDQTQEIDFSIQVLGVTRAEEQRGCNASLHMEWMVQEVHVQTTVHSGTLSIILQLQAHLSPDEHSVTSWSYAALCVSCDEQQNDCLTKRLNIIESIPGTLQHRPLLLFVEHWPSDGLVSCAHCLPFR